jgi:hypothetical protein
MFRKFSDAGVLVLFTSAAAAQVVQLPEPHWSIEKFERNGAPGAPPAPLRQPGLSSALAESLGERGLGIDHSAIIVGHSLGGGLRLYLGAAPGKVPHVSVFGAGVEYSIRF